MTPYEEKTIKEFRVKIARLLHSLTLLENKIAIENFEQCTKDFIRKTRAEAKEEARNELIKEFMETGGISFTASMSNANQNTELPFNKIHTGVYRLYIEESTLNLEKTIQEARQTITAELIKKMSEVDKEMLSE